MERVAGLQKQLEEQAATLEALTEQGEARNKRLKENEEALKSQLAQLTSVHVFL